jgi:hypothetical protein
MDVFVTFRTLPRSAVKIRRMWRLGVGRCLNWAMTSEARGALVRPLQTEPRCGVIERPQFLPLSKVMACLTGFLGAMRIGMADGTVLLDEVILTSGVCKACQGLVAIRADHRDMSPNQREMRSSVACQAKRRGQEFVLRMAFFTSILIRRRRELPAMGIGVTFHARLCFQFVSSLFTRGLVTFHAVDRDMLTLQLEGAVLMLFLREQRRFETRLRVTSRAVVSGGAPGELPLVYVLVAIAAAFVRDRLPEVGALVALLAVHLGMLAFEREPGLLVVEP